MAIKSYREWAAHCRYMAAKAPSEALRADWSKVAAIWLQMAIDQAALSPERKVQIMLVDAVGTGEDHSPSSH
jgi:hypothetical protein